MFVGAYAALNLLDQFQAGLFLLSLQYSLAAKVTKLEC